MNCEQYRVAIQEICDNLQKLVDSIGAEPWRGTGIDDWDPMFSGVLKGNIRLAELSAQFKRQLRGELVDVDRRNKDRLLSDYFDAARDGSIDRETFVRGIARMLERR
jgi:hypothetical protein